MLSNSDTENAGLQLTNNSTKSEIPLLLSKKNDSLQNETKTSDVLDITSEIITKDDLNKMKNEIINLTVCRFNNSYNKNLCNNDL